MRNTFSVRCTLPRSNNGPQDLNNKAIFLNLMKHNERALQNWSMS
jgi:hypothetical protein